MEEPLILTKTELKEMNTDVMEMLYMSGAATLSRIEELEALKDWELSIEFMGDDISELLYTHKDILRGNFYVLRNFRFEQIFGEINYN